MASRLLIDTTRLQKCRCFDNRGNDLTTWLDQCEAMGCFTSTSLYVFAFVMRLTTREPIKFTLITTTASTNSKNGISAAFVSTLDPFLRTESCGAAMSAR